MIKKVPSILIKISGDVSTKKLINFVKKHCKNCYVVIICGGGSKINRTLRKAGFEPKFDRYGRRIMKTMREREIQRETLEHIRDRLQNVFIRKGIPVHVQAPFHNEGDVLCPTNGDDRVKMDYLGNFHKIFVLTTSERRAKKKRKIFGLKYSRIQVIILR